MKEENGHFELFLKRTMCNKTYKEEETIKGVVCVKCKGERSHNGLSLMVDGTVKLQLSARSVGRFEAFYNSLKPILCSISIYSKILCLCIVYACFMLCFIAIFHVNVFESSL